MNKVKNIFTIILFFIFIIILFKYNDILNNSVIEAVTLWLTKVFPSLFITFVLNDILINSNTLNSAFHLINPLFNRIFNTTGVSSQVFFLSLFSGTPTSAFIIKETLMKKQIDLKDANKLIAFTYFSNPLFLYNILNTIFNKHITIKIILIHYFSNIAIGLILRKKYKNKSYNYAIKNEPSNNIFYLLPNAMNKSISTLLMILGTITFYMIISNIIIKIFNFQQLPNVLIKGLLEITQGLNGLKTIEIPSIIKEIIAISIISFGGLSVHTQILSLISDTKILYKNFITGRIMHVLISATSYFFLQFFIAS